MSKRKRSKLDKPTDVKQWWCAPHCGPGTMDTKEECGFCGDNVIDCALRATQVIKDYPDEDLDNSERTCGGSGFWCHSCGRFWAQDSCGEKYLGDMASADDAATVVVDTTVYCVCGTQLGVLAVGEALDNTYHDEEEPM